VIRSLRQLDLLGKGDAPARVTIPAREVFAFTLPLIASDLAAAVMANAGALTLGVMASLDQVAMFTVAVPLAALNQTVARNFNVMYTPVISRLFARDDREGINAMYWRTAAWVAVLTFPVFVVTFAASAALLQLLYGTKYLGAAAVLALLALGEYANIAFGLSGLTLRLVNSVRVSVAVHFTGAVMAIVLSVLLVPRYGALGAALATSGTMLLTCVAKQVGLSRRGVKAFDLGVISLYLAIAASAATVLTAAWLLPSHPSVPLALAVVVSLLVLLISRSTLRVAETFPEVRRVPLLRGLFA
jgi:O-antigen/teichoic acid export membrane protein